MVSKPVPVTKVVIDTDAGVDDALALFLALVAHKDVKSPFTIVGITTVLGNTDVDNVCKNVFKVLDCAEVTDIPVYLGAGTPLVNRFVPDEPAHFGKDGFSDISADRLSTIYKTNWERKLEAEPASLALARLAHEYRGELTVVALGPLTNVAIAINVDPAFVTNIRELFVMGGNLYGVGNIRPCVEFNFYVDPESAYVVLSSKWNKNIVLVPWETCIAVLPPQSWRINVLGAINNNPIRLMNMIETKPMENYARWYGEGKWISADSVLIAALLKPDIISKVATKYCTVELHGSQTRGQMVVDHPQRLGSPPNVTIIENMKTPELEKFYLNYFNRL